MALQLEKDKRCFVCGLDIKLCAHLDDGSIAAEGKGRMMIIKH